MPTKSFAPVRGRRIRVTRLDGCGRFVYGEDSVVVSKGFTTVSLTANTSESDEINVTNASGETCVFEASTQTLNGYGLELSLCDVDPELVTLLTGQEPQRDAFGNIIGFDIDTSVSLNDVGFAFELWTGVASGDACDNANADGNFGYMLFPYLQGGILGDFTVENGAVTFTITGAQTKNGGAWGRGPFDVQRQANLSAGPLLNPVKKTTAMRMILVDVAPPEAETGSRPLMDPATSPLTSVTATPDGLDVDIAVVPDAEEGESIWYDFGDETWDYVVAGPADGGDTTHAYSEAGTYTITAFNGGSKVTTSVTVTV